MLVFRTMNKKDFTNRKKEIKAHFEAGYNEIGTEKVRELITELFSEKEFVKITQINGWSFVDKSAKQIFETAYALVETDNKKEAEAIYQKLLNNDPDNYSILNNLSNIKKEFGDIEKAWELISKAYDLGADDEIISRNYDNLSSIIEDIRQEKDFFKSTLQGIERENDFVIGKLDCFLKNVQCETNFSDFRIPIPNWKFKVLMQTDSQKADSLRDQWLEKGYIKRTGDRGQYNEHVYKINPYIQKAIASVKRIKLPEQWIEGIEKINAEELSRIGYFEILDQVSKVKKKFKNIILRDINELFLKYLLENNKAVIVMSGSLVETLLIYFCEKRGIKNISYSRGNRNIKKKLYASDLGDLLSYFQEQKHLSDILVHMGNISRISRNFIHPGKELRDTEELNQAKTDLCFISAIEIIKFVCTRRN
jgi:hypothetical protein